MRPLPIDQQAEWASKVGMDAVQDTKTFESVHTLRLAYTITFPTCFGAVCTIFRGVMASCITKYALYTYIYIVHRVCQDLLHCTTLFDTSFPINFTLFHFTFLPFGFTPFKFSITLLHFTSLLQDFRKLHRNMSGK